MSSRYDLVVLGGGAAGLVAAQTAAALGARVVLVERQEQPGGDCLFTGCVPSKSLIASAKLAHDMRTADRLGLDPREPEPDLARVMERVQQVIDRAGEPDTPAALAEKGVEVLRGAGRFVAPGKVEVGERTLDYRAALIATGSVPAIPDLPGLRDADPLTNETVFDLRELPKRLAVLGGGPVGVELAQAFARLGARVEIVEASGTLLPKEEHEAGRFIGSVLEEEGVQVHAGSPAERVESGEGGRGGRLVTAEGNEIDYDRLLVALGRRAVTGNLGLETVGVETTADGAVRVDERLRTTGDRIFAAGDVVGQLYFTHVAAYHGLVSASNALFRTRLKVDYKQVPWVTFTDPEVARVGMSEAQATERLGRPPLVFRHDYARSDRALTAAEARGFAKLVTDRRGRMLGGTLVGPAAGESIAGVARLVRDRGRVSELSQTIHAYPTFTEVPARAADEWWQRRYLTPTTRRLMRPLLAIARRVDHPRGRARAGT